ncbi:MAG: hypothetical protein LBM72_00930 [Mycoplasmataceae bacterium]|jgi:addiction module RelB/DinJ family antitoxin|nr:hypothetical protein [Mycoplasmataceae bacterium]
MADVLIKIDDELLKEFEKICLEIGLDTQTAFFAFAKTVVRSKGLPIGMFNAKPFNEEEMKRIIDSLKTFKEKMEQLKVIQTEKTTK